jgi:EAL domain-containing protein (putative c-di-GMP-specific phosphodiesterase class I)
MSTIAARAARGSSWRRLLSVLPEGTALPYEVWSRRHRWILIILWLHVPALFVFALIRGNSPIHGLAETSTVAGLAFRPSRPATSRAAKHSCAGTTLAAGCCTRTRSSRSPRRPALIEELGRQVLATACRQASEWRDRHGLDTFSVSVNVSARQLLNDRIVEDVRLCLEQARLAPSALVLELTESTMLQDTEGTIAILRRLKQLGIRLAIDDFGTGYSSLSYLQRFPLDILKIDRAFVTAIDSSSDDASLAPAVVSLANTMHLKIVAEGVETPSQADALAAMGCELAQGFMLARPMPAGALDDLLTVQGGQRAAEAAAGLSRESPTNAITATPK